MKHYLNGLSDTLVANAVEQGESFKPYSKIIGHPNPLQYVLFLVVVNKLLEASQDRLTIPEVLVCSA